MAEADTIEGRTVDEAALWHVDLADIAKQTDVPTNVLLDALITSTAPGPTDADVPGALTGLLLTHLWSPATGMQCRGI
jgi:hypothetical protein